MNKYFRWAILLLLLAQSSCSLQNNSVTGTVIDENGMPLAGAIIRVKATDLETLSDENGYFSLSGLPHGQPVFVTAWTAGYYINGVEDVNPGTSNIEIVLHAHHLDDNPDYTWLPSTSQKGMGEDQGCALCHSNQGSILDFSLPVDEWLLDAHSQSAHNPRFLSMYLGQDIHGNQSPETRYTVGNDYGRFPLPPDPSKPYFGPGYKLDFPESSGNCAACHTPLAAIDDPYKIDPSHLNGVEVEGISCDFCHKVWDVRFDPVSSLPYPNMPGVLSLEFRRPPEGHQFFAGPFDDVAPGEDTFSPIQKESQFCAACHFGVFWNTLVYNSFGEWLESSYSDPITGKTCQDCHMPPRGADHFALPDVGGVERNPETIFSHRMPGVSDEGFLQNAVTLKVEASQEGNQLSVDVSIFNSQTGHHVPTDSPLRQLILLVQARGTDGEALDLIDGPVVPEWGGTGDPNEGYYAGLPGKGYAKILMEMWTEITPTGAYWNPTQVVSDNRLAAFETDTSKYSFEMPEDGKASVTVILLFRRAFIELMDQKEWDAPDIIMEKVSLTFP